MIDRERCISCPARQPQGWLGCKVAQVVLGGDYVAPGCPGPQEVGQIRWLTSTPSMQADGTYREPVEEKRYQDLVDCGRRLSMTDIPDVETTQTGTGEYFILSILNGVPQDLQYTTHLRIDVRPPAAS